MLRLAVLGALVWGLIGLLFVSATGCAAKPIERQHDEIFQWNIHAQPPYALLEALNER